MSLLVFISYATPDSQKYQIANVAKKLKEYSGIDNVLFWEEHMNDDIMKYMNDNLGLCDVVLIFCSDNALKSEPVELEWMSALKLGKKIVPVFTKEEHIPPLLTTKLGVEFQNDLDVFVESVHKLILKKQKNPEVVKKEEKKRLKKTPEEIIAEMDVEELSLLVAEALFNSKKEVKVGKIQGWIKTYRATGVRYCHLRPYKFLEQNPNKKSVFGTMAKEGKQVMWVIKYGRYYGRWVEGEFTYMGD